MFLAGQASEGRIVPSDEPVRVTSVELGADRGGGPAKRVDEPARVEAIRRSRDRDCRHREPPSVTHRSADAREAGAGLLAVECDVCFTDARHFVEEQAGLGERVGRASLERLREDAP